MPTRKGLFESELKDPMGHDEQNTRAPFFNDVMRYRRDDSRLSPICSIEI